MANGSGLFFLVFKKGTPGVAILINNVNNGFWDKNYFCFAAEMLVNRLFNNVIKASFKKVYNHRRRSGNSNNAFFYRYNLGSFKKSQIVGARYFKLDFGQYLTP